MDGAAATNGELQWRFFNSASADNYFRKAIEKSKLVRRGFLRERLHFLEQVGVLFFVDQKGRDGQLQAFGDAENVFQAGFAVASFDFAPIVIIQAPLFRRPLPKKAWPLCGDAALVF